MFNTELGVCLLGRPITIRRRPDVGVALVLARQSLFTLLILLPFSLAVYLADSVP